MKKRIIFLMVALVSCISMYAQSTKTITGTVVDDVAPLPGVGVQVSGTSNGVITDLDGNFIIKNVKPTDVLVFTYINSSLIFPDPKRLWQ